MELLFLTFILLVCSIFSLKIRRDHHHYVLSLTAKMTRIYPTASAQDDIRISFPSSSTKSRIRYVRMYVHILHMCGRYTYLPNLPILYQTCQTWYISNVKNRFGKYVHKCQTCLYSTYSTKPDT